MEGNKEKTYAKQSVESDLCLIHWRLAVPGRTATQRSQARGLKEKPGQPDAQRNSAQIDQYVWWKCSNL